MQSIISLLLLNSSHGTERPDTAVMEEDSQQTAASDRSSDIPVSREKAAKEAALTSNDQNGDMELIPAATQRKSLCL